MHINHYFLLPLCGDLQNPNIHNILLICKKLAKYIPTVRVLYKEVTRPVDYALRTAHLISSAMHTAASWPSCVWLILSLANGHDGWGSSTILVSKRTRLGAYKKYAFINIRFCYFIIIIDDCLHTPIIRSNALYIKYCIEVKEIWVTWSWMV